MQHAARQDGVYLVPLSGWIFHPSSSPSFARQWTVPSLPVIRPHSALHAALKKESKFSAFDLSPLSISLQYLSPKSLTSLDAPQNQPQCSNKMKRISQSNLFLAEGKMRKCEIEKVWKSTPPTFYRWRHCIGVINKMTWKDLRRQMNGPEVHGTT